MRRCALALVVLLTALPLGHTSAREAGAARAAPAAAAEVAEREPNRYELTGQGLRVLYSTTGLRGRPTLSYRDRSRSLAFTGDEIRAEATELGTLVTVTLRLLGAGDAGLVTFTLVVPRVNLGPGNSAPIETIGITTVRRLSMVPGLPLGQTDRYSVARLRGTARFVTF